MPESPVEKKASSPALFLGGSRAETSRPTDPSSTDTAPASNRDFQASQKEIVDYIDEKFEILLIAGIADSGKTELLEAYKQGKTLGEVVRKDGRAMPTSPGDLLCHPFPDGKRNLLFVDASGEHFEKLYKDPSTGQSIRPSDVLFLRMIAKNLRGVNLLFNLEQHWVTQSGRQQQVLKNLLILLRFLVEGGEYEVGPRSFQDQIDAQVSKLPRLRIPVQLLFSRADQLTGVEFPTRPDDQWLYGGAGGSKRQLYPPGEQPLLLTHNYLPQILALLEEHARTFRIDFVHSLTTDPDSGAVRSNVGCGVDLSRQWLIETSAQPWWKLLPTRHLLRGQSWIERKVLRRSRWYQLPPAKNLGGKR